MSRSDKNLAAWRALSRSHYRMKTHLETALKDKALPGLDTLDMLLVLRDATADVTAKDLESHVLMPQYGISRLLDRMEKIALIVRVPDSRDKRLKYIRLTERGQTTLRQMTTTRDAALETFLSPRAKPGQLNRMTDLLALLDQDAPD